jgi:prolyl oligopeptidase
MKKISLIFIGISFTFHSLSQYNYPATKMVDSADVLFGKTYNDPYRWLENRKDSGVINWFKQQADYTLSVLDKIPGKEAYLQETKELGKLVQKPLYTFCENKNNRLFYVKQMPEENVGKLYFRESMNEPEEKLFDPATYMPGKNLAIFSILPSHDGKKVAVAYTLSGLEINTIRVIDVDTKTMLADSVYPTRYGIFSWTPDNTGFTYLLYASADVSNKKTDNKGMLHLIGSDAANDLEILSKKNNPDLGILDIEVPLIYIEPAAPKYILGELRTVRNQRVIYYASLNELSKGKFNWKPLCKKEDEIINVGSSTTTNPTNTITCIGDDIFAISAKNATNHQLLRTSLLHPNWSNAEVIAKEKKDEVLEHFVYSKNYLIYKSSNGISSKLYKYNLTTKKTTAIGLPLSGEALIVSCLDYNGNQFRIAISSYIKPLAEFIFLADAGNFQPSTFNITPVFPEKYASLVVEEVEVKGHDGVMIPLTIIYPKGIKKDGKNICLMDGYGAYGISRKPVFISIAGSIFSSKGTIYAVPHVRGGGEKGEVWRLGGFKTTKPNTWKDFNSCAEYLVAKGFTQPSKLACRGGSAGGILISRAITERPNLYAAAICNVGLANAMRVGTDNMNVDEFGNIKDSVECRALYEMDGMQHVVKNTNYPALLATGGWNDSRVQVWQPGKFAAAMQQANISNKPILMQVNYEDGHYSSNRENARTAAMKQILFILWQCGHPDYQF